MVIILNELSLAGQFSNAENFKHQTECILPMLYILKKLNITVQKNQLFFQSNITSSNTLLDILHSYKSDETYRAFKNSLLKLCTTPPYWEDARKHSCDDEYKCSYTDKKCEYGLAEAVEHDKVTLSFPHDNFTTTTLNIKKNNTPVEIENLLDINQLRKSIVEKLKSNILTIEEPTEEYFPKLSLSSSFLKHCRYEQSTEGKSHEDKIAAYKEYCYVIALLSSWEYSDRLTRINNRITFQRTISGRKHNLELDTEKGTFEIHKQGYGHIDEYNFYGVPLGNRDPNRQTNF